MAGDVFLKVTAGQPIQVSASAYNAIIDAVRAFSQGGGNGGPGGTFALPAPSPGIVKVRNDSGADRDRFDVLGASGVVFTPTDNLDGFKSQFVLTGIAPMVASHIGRFVVLQEPVADGKIGRAIISGATPVHLNVDDEAFGWADVLNADPQKLQAAHSGTARILFKEPGTGSSLWAIVCVGGGSAIPAGTANFQVFSWDEDNHRAGWDWPRAH